MIVLATVGSVAAQTPAAAVAGKAGYESKCGGCHSVDANRIGPLHRGVVGRKIASVAGYAYSPAIKKLSGAWTPARLNQWLQNPQAMAPGTRMYLSIPDATQRSAIISYLTSVSPHK
ncbi:MAG: c-type cytochrome [Sphingomonadaceae bacterium]